jgi:uncharacterized protein
MRGWISKIGKILSLPLVGLVYFYKYAVSPFIPASCRHVPTCSEYMIQSLNVHGPFKGLWLGTRRIARCHPWGTHGYDPVPPKGTKIFRFPRLKKG